MFTWIRSLFGLKGDTKKESADKYISRLDDQARFHIIEVSANLNLLRSEIEQFKTTVDKINAQLPGQQEKKI